MKLRRPPTYATVISGRHPEVKYHVSVGMARKAVGLELITGQARGGRVYKWNGQFDEWDLMYDIPVGTAREDLPWKNQ